MKLFVATNNQGKLREVQEILAGVPIDLVTPAQFGLPPEFDPPETGNTFQENAQQKAMAFAEKTGLLSLSDDSGLCVTALGGKPGIHSKRFVEGSDHDRNLKLLELVKDQPDRSAYFISVICLYDHSTKQVQFFEGRVEGRLAAEGHGTQGFGYDPIFIPTGYEQTFGELGSDIKNKLSHRARALEKVKEYLNTL
jgi:XTP/dITP diphosphohydrolase